MKWVKASERLPKERTRVFAIHNKGYRCVIDLWVSEYGDKFLNFSDLDGSRLPEKRFNEIEWLDETEPQ